MIDKKRYLVTAALPYANGPLHIGHLAGVYLSADIYVRFQRMMGKDIVFICGSDEHGAAITMKALKEKCSPQEIIDKYNSQFKETFARLGISFDIFHRTSEPLHHKTAQDFFVKLYQNGEFVEKESEQYFDEEASQFLADRYIIGTCPKCSFDKAYGDQCENCGSTLNPSDLIRPKSTLSGSTPVWKKTTHWFLPLDKYSEWLKIWLDKGELNGEKLHDPGDWKAHVLGQCRSWIEGGLEPRAMTRDLDWGVDVPTEIPGSEGKKLYVWLDAPIGYISATKQWAQDNNKDWELYWKDKDTALIHFLGKDNIVFHCIIFPAILKAHGDFILPVNIPANQFMNLEGDKISTSRNWAVWAHEYLDEMGGKADELRYSLTRNMPETKDSEFTWKIFQDHINNELVNNLANFFNRVIVLINKYYEGVIPEIDQNNMIETGGDELDSSYYDSELISIFDLMVEYQECINRFDFRSALKAIMQLSSYGNQILQANEPWKNHAIDPETVKVVMALSAQVTAVLALAIRPFMPFASDRMLNVLNMPAATENGELLHLLDQLAEGEGPLVAGHKIGAPIHLFTRITDETIQFQLDKLKSPEVMETDTASDYAPEKTLISYDQFSTMDIRTAVILEAHKIEGADKLLQLTIDLGYEQRVVVSGIALHFRPEEIIGRRISVLANLAPRKIRGVESKGMILMAEDADGRLKFVEPNDCAPGMIIQ